MENKGYTIMEAVIAMFLVVVMVGAVFSALMSSRRAMVVSSDREEILYSIQSSYGLIKGCRVDNCLLKSWSCQSISLFTGETDISNCDNLFTFNFENLCKRNVAGNSGSLIYTETPTATGNNPSAFLSVTPGAMATSVELQNFEILNIQATCQEAL